MSMYYIYEDTIAFEESAARGVVPYAFPRSERTANEMMLNARNRYAFIRSLPRPAGKIPRKYANSPVTLYAEGIPVDTASIQNLNVPSISFVLGSSYKKYAATKEEFDSFILALSEYRRIKNKRKLEVESMTYADLVRYYVEFPMDKQTKDLLLVALSNLGSGDVGPNLETKVTNREMMEGVYGVLRGFEESGDDTTIVDLIKLGAYDSTVDYIEEGD